MADYGSADGGTSQEMWGNLIKQLRDNNDKRERKNKNVKKSS